MAAIIDPILMASLALGIAIGSALVAIFYMLGSFLQSDQFKAYTRTELAELFFSVIIVLVILIAYTDAGGIIGAVTGVSGGVSPSDISSGIVTNAEKPLESAIKAMGMNIFRFTKVASYNFNLQSPNIVPVSVMTSASPGAGANPIMSQMMMSVDTMSMTLMLTKAMRLAYLFMEFGFTMFLLPLGIVLRFVPPTRKIAGVVLAIGLAVHLVFPAAAIYGLGIATSAATSLSTTSPDTYLKDLTSTKNGGLLLPDKGNPPAAKVIGNPTMSAIYSIGELIGPSGVCLIGCGLACAAAALLGGAGFPACYAACYGKPPSPAPWVPGWGCTGIVGMLQYLTQIGFPIATTIALSTDSLNMTSEEIASEYYDPLVQSGGIMDRLIARNLAILMLVLIELVSTIVLARAFASVLGAEGQFYGLTKLV